MRVTKKSIAAPESREKGPGETDMQGLGNVGHPIGSVKEGMKSEPLGARN
jgi:hypothetical protein